MKAKIIISGPKVHDVGYRPFLADLAIQFMLRGFEVRNVGKKVIALAEGDAEIVSEFIKSVKDQAPKLAKVEEILTEDYSGDVMDLWRFSEINTSAQMNKAIPLLLEISCDIKGLREEVEPGFSMQFRQMQKDITAIKERLGMP